MPPVLIGMLTTALVLTVAALIIRTKRRQWPEAEGVAVFLGIAAFCIGSWGLICLTAYTVYTLTT